MRGLRSLTCSPTAALLTASTSTTHTLDTPDFVYTAAEFSKPGASD